MGLAGWGASALVDVALARLLPTAAFGDFKVAYAFALFFGMAVLLGGDRAAPMVLSPLLARSDTAGTWEYLRFYLRNALWLSAVVAALTWTASLLQVPALHPRHHHPLAWVVLAIPVNAAGAMVSRLIQSNRHPAAAALPWRVGLPALQLGLFGLAVLTMGSIDLAAAIVLSIAASALVLVGQTAWALREGILEIQRAPGAAQGRRWLADSLPMMGTFLVALTLNQSDLYFLETLGDESEVGRYAAASTLAHFLLLLQTAVVSLVAPLARPAIDRGPEASLQTYRRGQRMMLLLLVPGAAALALAGDPLLALFGSSYRAALPVLLFLTLGNFTWAVAALDALWLQYRGGARTVLAVSVATLLVDSALNLLLIPRLGMIGAAGSTALTFSAAALALLVLQRCRRLPAL